MCGKPRPSPRRAALLIVAAASQLPLLAAEGRAEPPRRVVDLRFPSAAVLRIDTEWGSMGTIREIKFVGDVNGDGYDEFLIQNIETYNDDRADQEPYMALVYGAPRDRYGQQVHWSNVKKTRFTMTPGATSFPWEPGTPISDWNHDGFDDFALATDRSSCGDIDDAGRVIVVFGAGELPPVVSLGDPAAVGVQTATIVGCEEDAHAGQNSTCVDLNSDGHADLALSAFGSAVGDIGNRGGVIHVVFGPMLPGETVYLEDIPHRQPGLLLQGAEEGDLVGGSLRSLGAGGDVNGDGYEDLIVASRIMRDGVLGGLYIVFGGPDVAGRFTASHPETFGVELAMGARGGSGLKVSGIADFDGDGFGDFAAARYDQDEALIVFGMTQWPSRARVPGPEVKSMRLSARRVPHPATTLLPGLDSIEDLASSVAVGNWNGDPLADLFVGASRHWVRLASDVGAGHLILGRPTFPTSAFDDEVGSPAIPGASYHGTKASTWFGQAADGSGDFDGDGFDDFLVTTATRNGWRETEPGVIHVIYGRPDLDVETTMHAIEPCEGSLSGGYEAIVHGEGFRGDESVWIDGVECKVLEVLSSARIRFVVPPGERAGGVRVRTAGSGGDFAAQGLFAYHEATGFPDLSLDLADLDQAGHRVMLFRDYYWEANGAQFAPVFFHDLDRDGLDDLFIGSVGEGEVPRGRVSVIFGRTDPALDIGRGETGRWGFEVFAGEDTGGRFGTRLAFPGDVDGDGFEDLTIGGASSHEITDPFTKDGQAFVLFGRRRWAERLLLDEEVANGRAIQIDGEGCGDSQVAGPGDMDGDERPDVFVGFQQCNGLDAEVWAFQQDLSADDPTWVPTSILRGDPTPIEASALNDPLKTRHFGYAVSRAGDLNADGWPDLLVGADHKVGAVYVVFGGSGPFPSEIDGLELVESGLALRITRHGGELGRSLASLGDFNGDGIDDAALGAIEAGREAEGEVYIVFGSTRYGVEIHEIDLHDPPRDLVRTIRGAVAADKAGHAYAIGDVNGDGFADLGIGSENHHRGFLRWTHVVFGEQDPPRLLELGALGHRGFTIQALEGYRFSSAHGGMAGGDLDGDGHQDLAIGVYHVELEQKHVVVIFGRAAGGVEFIRGDANSDLKVNLSDPVAVLNWLFGGDKPIPCLSSADANDDGGVEITDAIYVLNFLFAGGPAPAPPFPERGVDPTSDDLPCR